MLLGNRVPYFWIDDLFALVWIKGKHCQRILVIKIRSFPDSIKRY